MSIDYKRLTENELDTFIASLEKYRKALVAEDEGELIALLDEGRKLKQEVDG